MSLSMNSDAFGWLGWVALVPVFFAIRLWNPACALLGGALWGAGLFAFSTGNSPSIMPPSWGGFLTVTGAPAAYACLGSWLTSRIGFSPFVLGVGWMGVELAFGSTGLRSGLSGLAGAHGAVFSWLGQALGWVLVAFVVALVNAWIVVVINGVRLRVGEQLRPSSSADHIPLLFAQTFMGFPLFAVPAPRPRAPPA